jgi:hypothetical protein
MKKIKNLSSLKKYQQKKEYSNYKRKNKNYISEKKISLSISDLKIGESLLKRKAQIYTFLDQKIDFKDYVTENKIEFPADFSFTKNYEESIKSIYRAIYSYHNLKNDKIIFSFEKCKIVEITCLFLLDNLLEEVFIFKTKLQKGIKYNILNEMNIIESPVSEVNKRLAVLDKKFLTKEFIDDLKLIPIDKLEEKGSKRKKSYLENKKSQTTTKIIKYLNKKIIESSKYILSVEGVNYFQGIISEIIDNSEQHSYFNGEWFVNAFSFEDLDKEVGDKVTEIQLHFLNFGASIVESFEETRVNNKEQFGAIESKIAEIKTKTKAFSYENLFTLLSLNQGVSSLYYEGQSRGTGTINFINSFFEIGDFKDEERNIYPEMIILSGATLIKIDTKYRTFLNEDKKFNVSLNETESIDEPPEKTHLKSLKNFFPGTLISMRVYINDNHLTTKANNDK